MICRKDILRVMRRYGEGYFMTIDEIAKKYVETTQAILICAENRYYESVLILLYSAIDSLSWLYSEQMDINKRSVGKEYKNWVNKFLLPNLDGYNCTAEEIYLARCALTHTYSAIAKKQNHNRIIVYLYGDKEFEKKTNNTVNELNKITKEKYVCMHTGDMVNAFIKGTSDFFKQIESDIKIYDNVISKAEYYYRT